MIEKILKINSPPPLPFWVFFLTKHSLCFLKNLAGKTQWDKIWTKEKRVQYIHISNFPPHVNIIMISSTFQMVDLSIFAFQCHNLTFSI